MSSFLVVGATINRVVSWLDREVSNPRADSYYALHDLERRYGIALGGPDWQGRLARQMHALNVRAVEVRYGDEEAGVQRGADQDGFAFWPLPEEDLFQVFKSLRCWIYQCSEGTLPRTKLYRFFEEVSRVLAFAIVYADPGWKVAQWG